MANDYGELFCQAVDTIVKQRLEGVSYDNTILCTVVDDGRASEGIYKVSNGSAAFDACCAETNYKNNDNVYVSIPGGDWNEQKIIIAKKTDKKDDPYVYHRPFSSFVDITGNLINKNINSSETGLIANADEEGHESISLWSYNVGQQDGPEFVNYTRLGIQAGFQSWLNPFYLTEYDENGNVLVEQSSAPRYVTSGDYGLRLRIKTEEETTSKDKTEIKNSFYDLYLNCADMNGNPYSFEAFHIQEKVYDISDMGKIISLELQFYQKPGTFLDKDGKAIPCKDFLNHYQKPNLYVSDPFIGLGYDVTEFNDEMVTIYTFDSKAYSVEEPSTSHHKKIMLRWIHKQKDGSFKSITLSDKDIDYEVRWYRYALGHSSADNYSGVYWKYLSIQETKQGVSTYEIKDPDWELYNKTCEPGYKREPGYFSTWCIPDAGLQQEQIKAIIVYNGQPYRSNILICTNDDEVVSKPTVDAVQALSIGCVDKWIDRANLQYESSYGNYRIYNQGNSLIDYSQAQIIREWVPFFNTTKKKKTDEDNSNLLTEAESIEWIIPTDKTMIVIDDEFIGQDYEVTTDLDKRLHIKRYGPAEKGYDISQYNTQKYRIKGYYSQNYSDNTIQCKVIKDKITYTATKELTFGVAGTTGTDYTFVLDFDNGITAVTDLTKESVIVTARLYDYENNEITDLADRDIKWSFKSDDGKGDGLLELSPIYAKDENDQDTGVIINNKIEVKRSNREWTNSNYNILQASVEWGWFSNEEQPNKTIELIAYLPIPIRSSNDYAYISGTTQVIYNSAGEILDYFKNPYAIYNKEAEEISHDLISWTVINKAEEEDGYYTPVITQGRDQLEYLTPLSFYVEGACKNVCIVGKIENNVVWSQPLLIIQNKYPSAMINRWDGSLQIDQENGTILSPRLVAGKKNDDEKNTFSGVMIGDWEGQGDDSFQGTGIYGFDHGEQSYAFKENGTAFIGKSSAGRIEFNENGEGTIKSASYDAGQGMLLNLKEGTIDAHQFTLSAGDISYEVINEVPVYKDNSIIITTSTEEKPLRIGSNFYVDWDGTLHAIDGEFEGRVEADEGKIGGWTITSDGLSSESEGTKLYSNGTLEMGYGDYKTKISSSELSLGGGSVTIDPNKIVLGAKEGWWGTTTITTSEISLGAGDWKTTISGSEISLGGGSAIISENSILLGLSDSWDGYTSISTSGITLGGGRVSISTGGIWLGGNSAAWNTMFISPDSGISIGSGSGSINITKTGITLGNENGLTSITADGITLGAGDGATKITSDALNVKVVGIYSKVGEELGTHSGTLSYIEGESSPTSDVDGASGIGLLSASKNGYALKVTDKHIGGTSSDNKVYWTITKNGFQATAYGNHIRVNEAGVEIDSKTFTLSGGAAIYATLK